MPHSLLIDELSTVEIRRLLNDGWDTVIVPLGATEQHGPALPLSVDNVHGVETALHTTWWIGAGEVNQKKRLGFTPSRPLRDDLRFDDLWRYAAMIGGGENGHCNQRTQTI
jgi:hypothetical protein